MKELNFKQTQCEQLEKSAIEYFRSNSGFRRLFEGFRKKYENLGHFGGTVALTKLTFEEKEAFEGFFRKSFQQKNSVSISASGFDKALQNTKYCGCNLEAVLLGYFSGNIVRNKDKKFKYEQERDEFFCCFQAKFQGTMAEKWLESIFLERKSIYSQIVREYREYKEKNDLERLKQRLTCIFTALNSLPVMENKAVRIAEFSARITGNPHFFDEGQKNLLYLIHGIEYVCQSQMKFAKLNADERKTARLTAEEKGEILFLVGLLRDDISNFVTCKGLLGYLDNGKEHKGMAGFLEEMQPLQLSLMNLAGIEKITSQQKLVYVVENPAVFAKLIENNPQIAIVCSYGQLRLAVLLLLDKLVTSGNHLNYSGDFDPEGLLIAEKLKKRYGDNLCFWRYEVQDYEQSKSSETVSPKRMKQLEKLTEPQLIKLANLIKINGTAGYQEQLF